MLELVKAGAKLAKDAGVRWVDDRCYRLAAALAYYALYSLFPLLLLTVVGVGFLVGEGDADRARLVSSLAGPGHEARVLVDQTLRSLEAHRSARGWGAVVGAVALLFGASGVFSELQASLDLIWRAGATASTGVWPTVRSAMKVKAVSFVTVVATALVVLASLVANTWLNTMGEATHGAVAQALWRALETAVSGLFLTLLLATIFRLVPHVATRWRDVLGGALVTAVLLVTLKSALAWSLVRLSSFAAYGVVGAVLGLLTWIYVASLAVLFGAELARVYAERYGSLAASRA